MKRSIVARRYASAFGEILQSQNKLRPVIEELDRTVRFIESQDSLKKIFKNPALHNGAKIHVLNDAFSSVWMSDTLKNFLVFLIERNRFAQISQIRDELIAYEDKLEGKVRGKVYSAFPLSENQTTILQNTLNQITRKQVILDVIIDPSLIGGLRTEIEGKIYDGSVLNFFESIRTL
ncbi:MAG: ATP synthase F1 subunit delta, partial [Nanoarchaeota archaeon]